MNELGDLAGDETDGLLHQRSNSVILNRIRSLEEGSQLASIRWWSFFRGSKRKIITHHKIRDSLTHAIEY